VSREAFADVVLRIVRLIGRLRITRNSALLAEKVSGSRVCPAFLPRSSTIAR